MIKRESGENKQKTYIFSILPDILMIIGFISVGFGLYKVYPPAMWIICGGLLILLGFPKKGAE